MPYIPIPETLIGATYTDPETGETTVAGNHVDAADEQGVDASGPRKSRETSDFGFLALKPNGQTDVVSRDIAEAIASKNGQLIKPPESAKLHSDEVISPFGGQSTLGDSVVHDPLSPQGERQIASLISSLGGTPPVSPTFWESANRPFVPIPDIPDVGQSAPTSSTEAMGGVVNFGLADRIAGAVSNFGKGIAESIESPIGSMAAAIPEIAPLGRIAPVMSDYEQYAGLSKQFSQALKNKEFEKAFNIQKVIEAIKNRHGGMPPKP